MSEQEINRIIAENIVRYMEKKGLTQVDVAEYMGVSQATVSNWCKGVKMPRMDKIDRLCELFGCGRSDLIEEPGTIDERQLLLEKAFYDRPDMKTLFDVTNDMDPEDVERFIKMIKAFKGE